MRLSLTVGGHTNWNLTLITQFAMWGAVDGSVAIRRAGFYSVDYELMPLEAVAGKTRVMED